MDAMTFDLLPLVEADVQLKRSGSWWIGPCPFCGGEDRFNLHYTSDGYRWYCRHCGDGKYHSAIDYIMRRENLNYPDALKRMGADKPDWKQTAQRTADLRKASEERMPTSTWRARGSAFVEECRQHLWRPEGQRAVDYLHSRGLTDHTIVRYGLGLNPQERSETLETWGLDGDGKVKLERGIVIPCIGIEGLYYIKIRRALPAESKLSKYVQVRGGKVGLFGWPNMRGAYMAILVEGEFDTMILDQEAGDIAAVCTLGSANASPWTINQDLLTWIYTAEHVLACYDNDESGLNGSFGLQQELPRVKVIQLPDLFHDINDAHLGGFDLADWLCREAERLGIVDHEIS